jgi:hypothetical protein
MFLFPLAWSSPAYRGNAACHGIDLVMMMDGESARIHHKHRGHTGATVGVGSACCRPQGYEIGRLSPCLHDRCIWGIGLGEKHHASNNNTRSA